MGIKLSPRLQMNTNDAIIEAIEANWGLSQILSFQVAPFISEGRFRLVLEEYEQPAMPIHIVHQEGRMVSSKTRSFVDFAVEMLRQELGQN